MAAIAAIAATIVARPPIAAFLEIVKDATSPSPPALLDDDDEDDPSGTERPAELVSLAGRGGFWLNLNIMDVMRRLR